MQPVPLLVASIYLLVSALRAAVSALNLRFAREQGVPEEFRDLVSPGQQRRATEYLAAQTRFQLWSRVLQGAAGVGFLGFGGFGLLDRLASALSASPLQQALLYFLLLAVLDQLWSLPFSAYHGFVLEERFGFHRSSLRTFAGDRVKGWLLGICLGAPACAAASWLLLYGGPLAWLKAWAFLALFQLLLSFLAPALLLPLFNRFEPLPPGELRDAIEAYARKEGLGLGGVFQMDGSRRSSKANAFFTGFGRHRRLVLFDTLIAQHPVGELVAVLAHEAGHFRLGHVPKLIALSLAQSLLSLWLFGLVLEAEWLAADFGFEKPSLQAGVTIAFWLQPLISLLLSIGSSWLSRRFEFEADEFAARSCGDPGLLADALRRLSVESLSNLNPHPLKVALDYSHPPVVQRIRALRRLARA